VVVGVFGNHHQDHALGALGSRFFQNPPDGLDTQECWPFSVKVDCAVIEVEFFIGEKAAVFAGRPLCFIVSGCSKRSPSRFGGLDRIAC